MLSFEPVENFESDGLDQNGALVDPRTVGYVVVYVDDILTATHFKNQAGFHEWLSATCVGRGRPVRFLGMDIEAIYDGDQVTGYTLAQDGYPEELLREHQVKDKAIIPMPKEWANVTENPDENKLRRTSRQRRVPWGHCHG